MPAVGFHGRAGKQEGGQPAVAHAHGQLKVAHLAVAFHGPEDAVTVAGMGPQSQFGRGAVDDLFPGKTRVGAKRLIDVEETAVGQGGDGDDHGGEAEDVGQALLALAHGLVGGDLLGDVAGVDGQPWPVSGQGGYGIDGVFVDAAGALVGKAHRSSGGLGLAVMLATAGGHGRVGELQDALAEHGFHGQAEAFGPGAVDHDHMIGLVENQNSVGGGVEHGLQGIPVSAEIAFGGLAADNLPA